MKSVLWATLAVAAYATSIAAGFVTIQRLLQDSGQGSQIPHSVSGMKFRHLWWRSVLIVVLFLLGSIAWDLAVQNWSSE